MKTENTKQNDNFPCDQIDPLNFVQSSIGQNIYIEPIVDHTCQIYLTKLSGLELALYSASNLAQLYQPLECLVGISIKPAPHISDLSIQ